MQIQLESESVHELLDQIEIGSNLNLYDEVLKTVDKILNHSSFDSQKTEEQLFAFEKIVDFIGKLSSEGSKHGDLLKILTNLELKLSLVGKEQKGISLRYWVQFYKSTAKSTVPDSSQAISQDDVIELIKNAVKNYLLNGKKGLLSIKPTNGDFESLKKHLMDICSDCASSERLSQCIKRVLNSIYILDECSQFLIELYGKSENSQQMTQEQNTYSAFFANGLVQRETVSVEKREVNLEQKLPAKRPLEDSTKLNPKKQKFASLKQDETLKKYLVCDVTTMDTESLRKCASYLTRAQEDIQKETLIEQIMAVQDKLGACRQ